MNEVEKDLMLYAIDELAEQVPNGHLLASTNPRGLLLAAAVRLKELSAIIKGKTMGVMPCERAMCKNILCHKIINTGQERYICDECYFELVNSREDWPDDLTASQVLARVRDFMDTPKVELIKDTNMHFEKILKNIDY